MLLTALQPKLFLPDKRHSSSEILPVQQWADRQVISSYLFAAFCVLLPWLSRDLFSVGCSPWQALNLDQYLNKDAVVISSSSVEQSHPSSSFVFWPCDFQPECSSASSVPLHKFLQLALTREVGFEALDVILHASNLISAMQQNPQKPLETATKKKFKKLWYKRRKKNT